MDPEIKLDENAEVLAASNMATTSMDFVMKKLKPATFRRGDDVEKFIEKCEKFFKICRSSPMDKEIMLGCFLDDELHSEYYRVDESIKPYQDRLRKAFKKESTLMEDIKAALAFQQTNEEPEKLFEIIEELTNKIFDERLTKETFMEQLLIQSSNERDLQRELCLTETEGLEGVKEKIRRLHKARKITEKVMPIGDQKPRSYRDVTNNGINNQRGYEGRNHSIKENQRTSMQPGRREAYVERRNQNDEGNRRRVICWTCNQEGHFSRDCSKRVIKCFACGKEGHIRSECPNIKCNRCNKNGHYKENCRTNLDRMNYRRPYENRRRQGEAYGSSRYYQSSNRNYEGQNRNYQGPNRYNQGPNRNYQGNNRNQVACMNYHKEERYENEMTTDARQMDNEGYNDEYRDYPNEDASTKVEIVGAVY